MSDDAAAAIIFFVGMAFGIFMTYRLMTPERDKPRVSRIDCSQCKSALTMVPRMEPSMEPGVGPQLVWSCSECHYAVQHSADWRKRKLVEPKP